MNANSLYAKIKEYDKVIILVASIGLSIGGGKLIPNADMIDLKSKHEEQKSKVELITSKFNDIQTVTTNVTEVHSGHR